MPITRGIVLLAVCAVGFAVSGSLRAADNRYLWQIGTLDGSDSEFALAHGDYKSFQEDFGSPDHAFYIGLSNPQTDWPCVLPGIVDGWAGSSVNARNGLEWDQMNTLPIGFVLDRVSTTGECMFTIYFCDASRRNPPRVRITVNGVNFERDLLPGGGDKSLHGDFTRSRPQAIRVEFPASLLKPGYNEIALRTTRGSWCLFDALRLETPDGFKLAPATRTVIRSVAAAPYAVSPNQETPATIRVEVIRKDSPGQLKVKIGKRTRKLALEAGLQTLEIPAPVSRAGEMTSIQFSADGRSLYKTSLALAASPPVTPGDYVDAFMGTAHSRWMIAPGPWMPFSMVKISPDNQPQGWCAGYDYTHEYIDCFSHIHEWTMAGLGMMPTVGPLRTHPGLDGTGYSSRIDKSTERGGIGFYEVRLADSGIKVDLTATTRTSLQRYTFPASDEARVLFTFLLPNEYEMHVLSAKVRRNGNNEIEGDIETDVPGIHLGAAYRGDQHYVLHFVSEFSHLFESLGGWQNLGGSNVIIKIGSSRPAEELQPGWHGGEVMTNVQQLALSGDCGAFVTFKTSAGDAVEVRTGISLVSVDDARRNLDLELVETFGWDFDAVVQNQRRVWNDIFDRVEIDTPNAREKTRFYTNLYRALSGRNTWSDVNGKWIDPEGRQQQLADTDTVMLGCDALWTTFWNLNQVMNLVAPEWSARWVKSELQLYEKCGWLAKGPAGLKFLSIMVAEHEIPLMVAAYQAGISSLDGNEILAAAVKMQTSLPQNTPGGGRVGNDDIESYLKYGYVPADGPLKGRTSDTEEYAYDDWTVAQLALALGNKDVAETFLKRSGYWRNTFDVTSGYARPRKINGEWVTPFDPYRSPGFTEGNAWQYTWFVPQNVPGLVEAMGRDRFISRLNEGFETCAPVRFNGGAHAAVDQGNQPTMELSWLFNWAGAPWLTQKWTRAILDAYYGYNPADAYLGDEDQGQMSSWFVMSAIGLFQTDGGCRADPIYEIGSPLYPKIIIHLSEKYYGGKTFIIEAHNASPANRYIQSATFNGKPLNQWWIRQWDLINGGRLVLELGPAPNKNWAKGCPLPSPEGSAPILGLIPTSKAEH